MHNRLATLTNTLGPGFYPDDLLQPVDVVPEGTYPDVTPERSSKIEKELLRGKQEIQRRLGHLSQTLEHIAWLYTELGIPLPNAGDTSLAFVPSPAIPATYNMPDSNPFASGPVVEEPPLEHCARVFGQYVASLEEAADEGLETSGVDGVEPTMGLLLWCERAKTELNDLKTHRETTIQAMYDALESLWRRLGVPDEDADEFIEAHRGSTEETLRAYEEELARMIEVRRERMGAFIESARDEIRGLWDDLFCGEEEREYFVAMYDGTLCVGFQSATSDSTADEHSEDLLAVHEAEIARLKDERLTKAPVLTLLQKWEAVCEEGRQLAVCSTSSTRIRCDSALSQISAADQSRLLGKGPRGDPGRLLREEKMRKRVAKEKPKLETELRKIIPAWESENGRIFFIHGVRALEIVEAEADKEPAGSKKVRLYGHIGVSSKLTYVIVASSSTKTERCTGEGDAGASDQRQW